MDSWYYAIDLPQPKVFPIKKWYWLLFRIYGNLIFIPARNIVQYLAGCNREGNWRFFFSEQLKDYCWKGTVHVPWYSKWLHKILWKLKVQSSEYSYCACCGSEEYGRVIDSDYYDEDEDDYKRYYEELSSDSSSSPDGTYYYWSAYINCPRCAYRGHYSDSN